jgi:para-aminobenzoate synthetase component 1
MRARYSYLGVEPFSVIEIRGGQTRVDGTAVAGDPFAVLADLLRRYRGDESGPLPFCGGAMGFIGYEMGRYLERLPQRHPISPDIPEMMLGLYDLVIGFDTVARRSWILSSGRPETDPVARQARAAARARACAARIAAGGGEASALPPVSAWRPDLAEDAYRHRIEAVLGHIRAGDIFQANFTMRFTAPRLAGHRPFDLYRRLRALSPSPFAAYLGCGPALALASASPERFLALDRHGRIEARPIKGTRPRGADEESDRRARDELAASPKDRAENLMIVDLIRNDLGRVAVVGSIAVPSLLEVESFASVHHLVSAVTARLRPGLGPVDLLRAAFPGGSVTGAPKIRAMEIIDALEASARGAYCGAILWIGFDGAMDSSIVIRTLSVTGDRIVAQAGGGIVADSDPAAEYAELRVKLAPLLDVLGGIVIEGN